jgi:hypothetical protein
MPSRVRAVTQVRTHGTSRIPAAPRALNAQSAEGGVLLTWKLPTRYNDVTGYRIYTGSEKNLSIEVKDRGTRQMFVPLQSGGSPPLNNVFVSVVNGFREGPKLQLQVKTTNNKNLGNPIPLPTQDFQNSFSGGLDKTQSGEPSGRKVP